MPFSIRQRSSTPPLAHLSPCRRVLLCREPDTRLRLLTIDFELLFLASNIFWETVKNDGCDRSLLKATPCSLAKKSKPGANPLCTSYIVPSFCACCSLSGHKKNVCRQSIITSCTHAGCVEASSITSAGNPNSHCCFKSLPGIGKPSKPSVRWKAVPYFSYSLRRG